MSDLNIYQRINAVQKKVSYIKRGSAGQGTGVLYDEVVSEIRKEMVAQGIVITTHQQGSSVIVRDAKQPIFAVMIEVRFVNCDKPEDYFPCEVEAHAMDNGDKAPGKFLTYAVKSALVKVLLLESGINEESRGEIKEVEQGRNEISATEANQLSGLFLRLDKADPERCKKAKKALASKCKVTEEALEKGLITRAQFQACVAAINNSLKEYD